MSWEVMFDILLLYANPKQAESGIGIFLMDFPVRLGSVEVQSRSGLQVFDVWITEP